MEFFLQILIRSVSAVIIGAAIGSERARQGRSAGMRTHILVCLGATLTSLISIYVAQVLGYPEDVLRLSAQVISGIGFLGAGMIIHKENNIIMGLTTAAGVWTTGVIGIALGLGFYAGAGVVTALFLVAIMFLPRKRRQDSDTQMIYLEIDDMYRANQVVEELSSLLSVPFAHEMSAPKSGAQGHLGITLTMEKDIHIDPDTLRAPDCVVFTEELS